LCDVIVGDQFTLNPTDSTALLGTSYTTSSFTANGIRRQRQ
jgi:hypothetical protein